MVARIPRKGVSERIDQGLRQISAQTASIRWFGHGWVSTDLARFPAYRRGKIAPNEPVAALIRVPPVVPTNPQTRMEA